MPDLGAARVVPGKAAARIGTTSFGASAGFRREGIEPKLIKHPVAQYP
jgi:hypothetical protein